MKKTLSMLLIAVSFIFSLGISAEEINPLATITTYSGTLQSYETVDITSNDTDNGVAPTWGACVSQTSGGDQNHITTWGSNLAGQYTSVADKAATENSACSSKINASSSFYQTIQNEEGNTAGDTTGYLQG